MASGTGERPLGSIAEEKAAMELIGLSVQRASDMKLMTFGLDANTTYYLHFNDAGTKYGLLMLDGAVATKRGMYMYGAGTSSSMHLSAVLASSQSGTTVTASPSGKAGKSNYVKVVNGANYAFCMIIAYVGVLPTVTTTEPT